MQELLYEMGNCFLIQWPSKRDDAIAFRDYVLTLETEHRTMREALEWIGSGNMSSNPQKEYTSVAQKALSSLTLKP